MQAPRCACWGVRFDPGAIVFVGIGVLQDNVEDKWREEKAAAEETAEQEFDEQGKPLTKKQRQQLKRAADKERAKQRQATQDRMEPQVIPHRPEP